MTRLIKTLLGFGVLLGSLALGGTAFAQSGTTGPIKVWGVVNSSSTNRPMPLLVTGVIGDVGTEQTVKFVGEARRQGELLQAHFAQGHVDAQRHPIQRHARARRRTGTRRRTTTRRPAPGRSPRDRHRPRW